MSAVYSYEAARRHDRMIEGAVVALDLIMKELRPEAAAVLNAFPFRGSRCL